MAISSHCMKTLNGVSVCGYVCVNYIYTGFGAAGGPLCCSGEARPYLFKSLLAVNKDAFPPSPFLWGRYQGSVKSLWFPAPSNHRDTLTHHCVTSKPGNGSPDPAHPWAPLKIRDTPFCEAPDLWNDCCHNIGWLLGFLYTLLLNTLDFTEQTDRWPERESGPKPNTFGYLWENCCWLILRAWIFSRSLLCHHWVFRMQSIRGECCFLTTKSSLDSLWIFHQML